MASVDWRPAFLAALRDSGNVTIAARAAQISRRHAYRTREDEEEFAKDWDEAVQEACDLLEAEARRRAAVGIDKPIYYKGEQVATVKEYSDQLLMFLLKAHRPEKFRDNVKVDHGFDGPPPVFQFYPAQSGDGSSSDQD